VRARYGLPLLLALTVGGHHASAREAVTLSAAPILGNDAPTDSGWYTYVVRLENPDAIPVEGSLRLLDRGVAVSAVPFALGPRGTASVELTWHDVFATTLQVEARSGSGEKLHAIPLDTPRPLEPFVVDLGVPSRIAAGLSGTPLAIGFNPPTTVPMSAPMMSVATPFVEGRSGDLVLPTRAGGYSSATLVLAPSERLASLPEDQLGALCDWVIAGGSLAISVTRPEDLRSEPLATLAGGLVTRVPAPPEVLGSRVFLTASPSLGRPGAPPRIGPRTLAPDEPVLAALDGYTGGNLRPVRWGAAASYGLGEVHLLAYDLTSTAVTEDEWVRASTAELVRHAWDRRAHLALPRSNLGNDDTRATAVRRLLDPNEQGRWAIVASTVLLIVYAVAGGPFIFWRARRQNRPLAVLWQLPLLSMLVMLLVVGTGVAAKGVRGRAHHLTFVDAGAGMSRGATMRLRAFYTASASQLTIPALDAGSLLDVVGEGASRILVADRDGPRLERVVTRPWETTLVQEDGFMKLGGGISLTDIGGDVRVTNRVARNLLGVLVAAPGRPPRYFPRIADGQSVHASEGAELRTAVAAPVAAGSGLLHPLETHRMIAELEQASRGLGAAWTAIESLAQHVDWWPEDAPVLLAQLEGGEGHATDAGLVLETDRVLVRVVGFGGAP
jgi:hypothetical protein